MAAQSYAVVGGEGFVGHALVRTLARRYPLARVYSLGPTQRHVYLPASASPSSSSSSATAPQATVTFIKTNITSFDSIAAALEHARPDVVFHTVSPSYDAPPSLLQAVNVVGTSNVLRAAKESVATKALVLTSSYTVCSRTDTRCKLTNIDERLPRLGADSPDQYVATKAEAERLVLEANDPSALLTCALRFSGIIGPGDRQVMPGIMDVIKRRQHVFQLGFDDPLFDFVHVSDVVEAHLCAADALLREHAALDASPTTSSATMEKENSTQQQQHQRRRPSKSSDALPLPDLSTWPRAVGLTVPSRELPTSASSRHTSIKSSARAAISPPSSASSSKSSVPALRTRFNQFHPSSFDATSADEGAARTRKRASGRAYFISSGEPVPFWSFVRAVAATYDPSLFTLPVARPTLRARLCQLLMPSGGGDVQVKLPLALALPLASLLELSFALARRVGLASKGAEPALTRQRVLIASQDMFADIERARTFLGYSPSIGIEDAINDAVNWCKEQEREQQS